MDGGSYSFADIVLGASKQLSLLGLLDVTSATKQLHATFRSFPAVVESLPNGSRQNLLAPDFWRARPGLVAESALARALEVRSRLAAAIPSSDVTYVFGPERPTVTHLAIEGPVLKRLYTPHGDGLSPRELCVPDAVGSKVLLSNSTEMLGDPTTIRGISDLVNYGTTAVLANEVASSR